MSCYDGDTEFSSAMCTYIDACLTKRNDVITKQDKGIYSIKKDTICFIEFLRLTKTFIS